MIARRARDAFLLALVFIAPLALPDAFLRCAVYAGKHIDRGLAAQSEHAAFERGLLWRVERQGSEPSYVFGTVHLADKRVTALPVAVMQQLDAARSFTMEVALDPPSLATLVARMIYDDGRVLPAVVGDELYDQVVPLLAERGMPEQLARRFRPWAVMLILAMPAQNPEDVLDRTLHRIASQQKKTLHYLETVDDQVEAFEGMPVADQVALLRRTVETRGEMEETMRSLLEAYLARDLALIWRISEAGASQQPELKRLYDAFTQRLLFDRNAHMVTRMQPQLERGGAFIAVGALHLYGDKGILALLQRGGYRISRVY